MKLLEALYQASCEKGDAIIFKDEVNGSISYRDFEIATGKVYRYLMSLDLPKERIIAIRLKRSYWTFIAIAGALKAAVPYVVIGETSPKEYVDQVYEDCEPLITIDDEFLNEALKGEYLKGYKYRDIHDLAYIVYSTGSSGFFKGSMQEYGTIERMYRISSIGREMHKNAAEALESLSFFLIGGFYSAVSMETLVDVIVYRSRVIIIKSENANDVDYLMNLAQKENVYTMDASPRSLPAFTQHPLSCIKEYYVCYEMFPCKYSPDYKIYNGYGLSECGGTLCFMEIDKDYDIAPVGKPVPGFTVKMLNKVNEETKVNEIGELSFVPEYFRGYIKRMDLFEKAYSGGYFHTGDLGYYNEDGNIVIIGRKKDIKETADGYIVPLFVSNAVKKHFPEIENCYVKVFENEREVVAYYIAEHEYTLEEINSKISENIPEFSLPTCVKRMDKFDYFFCGKINGNSFEKPE